jgi:hypothetical protein
MVQPRWRHWRKPLERPSHQQQVHRLYTPTIDGFERFLREMVGLDGDIHEGSQHTDKRNLKKRIER